MKQAEHSLLLSEMGTIMYDGSPAEIEATKDYIQVNCTKISIEAIKKLLERYEEHFTPKSVILQTGRYPTKP